MAKEKYTLASELMVTDLSAKLILALVAGQGGDKGKFINSKQLAFLLGGNGRWSDYRHRRMLFLEGLRYVICMKAENKNGKGISWHYSLHPNWAVEITRLVVQ